jgi:hypothetical protein
LRRRVSSAIALELVRRKPQASSLTSGIIPDTKNLERKNYEKIKRRISTRWQQETGDPGQGCQVHTGSKVWNPEHEACIFAGRGWTVRV